MKRMPIVMGGSGVRGQPWRVQEIFEKDEREKRTNVKQYLFLAFFDDMLNVIDNPFRKPW